jgi:O-antigen/teichoic acid export membrane protein
VRALKRINSVARLLHRKSTALRAQIHHLFLRSANRSRTLRGNFLWNAGGNGVFALSQWGILVVFAKLGNPSLVGQLVYGIALTAPIFVVAGLQLRSIQATDATNRYKLGQYLGLRSLTTIAGTLVATIIVGRMWLGGYQGALIVLLWALSKAIDSGSDALYGFFQQSERMDYVGISLVLRGLLAFSSVLVVFGVTHSAALSLSGVAAGWIAIFLLFDIPVARALVRHGRCNAAAHSGVRSERIKLVLNGRHLIPLGLEAAPLGCVAFLLALQAQVPRYVVEGLRQNHELGLFSAAAYLTFVGSILVNALGAPACVRLAKYHVTGQRSSFRQLMIKLLVSGASLGVAGVLLSAFAGGRILAALYTKEYSSMAGVLTMLCAASAISFLASFYGYAMTAQQRYKVQVPIFVVVLTVTWLSCYQLTIRNGLMGTAVGMLIGNFTQLVLSAAVVWQASRKRNERLGNASGIPKEIEEPAI